MDYEQLGFYERPDSIDAGVKVLAHDLLQARGYEKKDLWMMLFFCLKDGLSDFIMKTEYDVILRIVHKEKIIWSRVGCQGSHVHRELGVVKAYRRSQEQRAGVLDKWHCPGHCPKGAMLARIFSSSGSWQSAIFR